MWIRSRNCSVPMLLVGLTSLASALVMLAAVAHVGNPVPFAISVLVFVRGVQAIAVQRLLGRSGRVGTDALKEPEWSPP